MIYLLHNIGGGPTSNYTTREQIKALPPDAILTFDGVYRSVFDNYDVVQGRKVILFVIGEWIGKDNSRDEGQPYERMCGWEELEAMRGAGAELAWHTWSHPDLTKLSDEELDYELAPPYAISPPLSPFGTLVSKFAYPYGKFDDRVVAAVERAGYSTAYTASRGNNTRYQIKRVHV